MIGLLRRLRRSRSGVTIVEFAIVAPVMIGTMTLIGDLLYQVYAQSLLDGALQKAGRDSAIQDGANHTDAIDGKVVAMLAQIMKSPSKDCSTSPVAPSWCSTRKNYDTFQSMKPEDFTDTNKNGVRDPGECFTDINNNGVWDADPGDTGQGGANDVTLYTMTITFKRLFPVAGLFGMSSTTTLTSKTVLKNQPYATQAVNTPKTVCT